jgi:hypothetical protein
VDGVDGFGNARRSALVAAIVAGVTVGIDFFGIGGGAAAGGCFGVESTSSIVSTIVVDVLDGRTTVCLFGGGAGADGRTVGADVGVVVVVGSGSVDSTSLLKDLTGLTGTDGGGVVTAIVCRLALGGALGGGTAVVEMVAGNVGNFLALFLGKGGGKSACLTAVMCGNESLPAEFERFFCGKVGCACLLSVAVGGFERDEAVLMVDFRGGGGGRDSFDSIVCCSFLGIGGGGNGSFDST